MIERTPRNGCGYDLPNLPLLVATKVSQCKVFILHVSRPGLTSSFFNLKASKVGISWLRCRNGVAKLEKINNE